jgi:putative transposase
VVSGGGHLVRAVLTGGEVNDVTQACGLVVGLRGRAVVGDRAYDSDAILASIEAHGMEVVIPSRANRNAPRTIDKDAYEQRNVIERFFGRLKQFRRVATRYEKTAISYAASVAVAASLVELSGWTP